MTISRAADPEFDLLVAASARPALPRHDGSIAGASVAGAIDWPRFLLLVERHRIAPLVFDRLASSTTPMPGDVSQSLRAMAMRDRLAALRATGVLAKLTSRLNAAGIVAVSLKGPLLAQHAFGDVSLRQSRDLDILIPEAAVGAAVAVLQTAGCGPTFPPQLDDPAKLTPWVWFMKDLALLHVSSGTVIELHWRLNNNPYLMPFDLGPGKAGKIGEITVNTLDDEMDLLYLCVHGAKHYWFRLKWLADVHALFSRWSAERIEIFYASAARRGLRVPVGQSLLLLEAIFGMAIPPVVRDAARRSWRTRWLVRRAAHYLRSVDEPESLRFATTRMAIGRFGLRADVRYWLREALELLVDWTVMSRMNGARWTYAVAVLGRPFFWMRRKLLRDRQ